MRRRKSAKSSPICCVFTPGLTLSIQEEDYFELVMKTAMRGLYEFMAGKPLSVKITEIEQPDVLLWAVWCVQQYALHVSKEACAQKYGKLVLDILDFIQEQKHPNLLLDENGLLRCEGKDKAVTWMNSTANGHPVVPRTGYIVEFNALWYNALRFGATMASALNKSKVADRLYDLAQLSGQSFISTFVNKYDYLFDYVDGDYR